MMKRLLISVLVIAAVAPAAAAAETAECGLALLQDVDVAIRVVPGTTVTTIHRRHGKPGDREWLASSMPIERVSKTYRVTVRLHGVVYTAESPGDAFWHFNPGRLVINDPIHACITKDRLHLRRPDGKDYETRIVRTVRDPQLGAMEASTR